MIAVFVHGVPDTARVRYAVIPRYDWSAILPSRAAGLRPELVGSSTMSSAPLDPEPVRHTTAPTWQSPEIGEPALARTTPEAMEKPLAEAGVLADDARAAARTAGAADHGAAPHARSGGAALAGGDA